MPLQSDCEFRAFLAYSHADTGIAKRLHDDLEQFAIDDDLVGRQTDIGLIPKSLFPIFRDREGFQAGGNLTEETVAKLDASAALVVVCSPNAARSAYVNEEVRLFKSRHPERPIIPFVIDGTPGDPERECLPPAIRLSVTPQGTITERPSDVIAADARRAADGWELALAKVIARLLGLAIDEIFDRVQRRRRKTTRVRFTVGFTLVVLLLAVVALLFAYDQRQRSLKEIETLIAKYSTISEARGADLDAKKSLSEAITAIVEGAATDPRYERALSLLQAGKPAEAEPLLSAVANDLATRASRINREAAAAYRNLGAIAGLADPKRAREAYAKAAELNVEDTEAMYWSGFLNLRAGNLVAAESPFRRLTALAQATGSSRDLFRAHLRLGEVSLARGDLQSALDHYESASKLPAQTDLAAVAEDEARRDRSILFEKLGDVLLVQGDTVKSLEAFRTAFAISESLSLGRPTDPQRKNDLSVLHNKIGDVLLAQGDMAAAIDEYRTSFVIRENLVQESPHHAGWRRDLSISLEKLGTIEEFRGNLGAALERFEAALGIREQIVRADPANSTWQRDVSVSYERIGDILQKRPDLAGALGRYRACLAIRERLTRDDPGNAIWQRDLSVSHNKIGDVLRIEGASETALFHLDAALAIRRRLADLDPRNAERLVDLALSHARLGQLLAAANHQADGLERFREARRILAAVTERSDRKLWHGYLRSVESEIETLTR